MSAPEPKKPTNLTLDRELLSEAKALKINLSRAAEDGVRAAVVAAREEVWRSENTEAVESSNSYVDAHGLPLERFRRF